MHPADIKALIAKKGYNFRQLDEIFGFPPKTCWDTLRTGRPSAEREIAKFLNLPPKKIWPDRYWPDGTRKNLRDRRHSSKAKEARR